jgi:hypothetical protein
MPTIRRSQAEIRKTGGRVHLNRVRATTDKDIMRWIAEDPDTAPELPSRSDLASSTRVHCQTCGASGSRWVSRRRSLQSASGCHNEQSSNGNSDVPCRTDLPGFFLQ